MSSTDGILGGVGVPGFGPWIKDSAREVSRTAQLLRRKGLTPDNAVVIMSEESHRDYAALAHRWRMLEETGTSPDGGDARADFEQYLVDLVLTSAEVLEVSQSQRRPSGRPMVAVDAEHGRACLFLARYLGIDPKRVRRCGADRESVIALAGVR